jgi:hypothetical protein
MANNYELVYALPLIFVGIAIATGWVSNSNNIIDNNNPPNNNHEIRMPVFLRYEENKTRLVQIYNQFNNDYIVGFTGFETQSYINQINGNKVIAFFNASQIIENINTLKSNNMNWVAYDLESSYSPQNEVDNPVSTVINLYNTLKSNNINLILTITNLGSNTLSVINQTVLYTDIFVLQTQFAQTDGPNNYGNITNTYITMIKQHNPNVKVIVQVSLIKGDLQNCKDSFSRVASKADGVTLFYPPQATSLNDVEAFWNWVNTNYS